jgi:outer membrane receptor protein involved in Fe transport
VEEYQFNNSAANQAAYLAGENNSYAAFGLPLNLSASNPYYGETANFTGPVAFETRDTQKLVSGSIYAQGTYHITENLRLILGARGTTDNQIGDVQDYFGLIDRNNGEIPQIHRQSRT